MIIYDASGGFNDLPIEFQSDYISWLADQGVDSGTIYRVEHHDSFVRVFEYLQNEKGHLPYYDPETDDLAKKPPYDVPIQTPAPVPHGS